MDSDNSLTMILQFMQMLFSQLFYRISPALHNFYTQFPDVGNLIILVVILYISLLMLRYTIRMIYSAIVTMIRLALLIVIVTSVFYLFTRGVDGFADDLYQMEIDLYSLRKFLTKYTLQSIWKLINMIQT